jgi:alkylation response protein AidB-like acyl-CoA dehydrogenase
MDFSLTDDQQGLRELARKMLEEIASHERLRAVQASESRVDAELWKELAKADLLGLGIDGAHGGSGGGLTELAILMEEVGRTVAPVPLFATLVVGAQALQAFGSEAQKQQWLPKVAAGEAVLTAALAQVAGCEVSAVSGSDGWRLSGQRMLVEAAHVADRILVPATTADGIAIFLVDPSASGASLERVETTDLSIRPTLKLDGVAVVEADVLADASRGAEALAWIGQRATLGLCAMQLGVAERALEITARYTSERKQFDRPIGSFQAVHTRAGDAFVDIQSMRLSMWRALHLLEQGEEATDNLAIAKFWASEGGARVTYAAQHLHGGIGIDIDYPLHRYYLWGRQIGMHLGSATAQLAEIGARLAS